MSFCFWYDMVFVLFLFCAGGIVETVRYLQILHLVVYALVILKWGRS